MDSSNAYKRSFFDCLSPRCGAALATVFAEVLAEGLDSDQMATLGGFLNIVGDSLAYMASQMDLNEAKCKKKSSQNDEDSDSDSESDNTEDDNEEIDNAGDKQKSKDKNGGGTQSGQGSKKNMPAATINST